MKNGLQVAVIVWLVGCAAPTADLGSSFSMVGGGTCAEPVTAARSDTPSGWERSVGAVVDELELPAAGTWDAADGTSTPLRLDAQVGDGPYRVRFSESEDGVCEGVLAVDITLELDAAEALFVPSWRCLATITAGDLLICSGDVAAALVDAPVVPDPIFVGMTAVFWGGGDAGDWQAEVHWTDDILVRAPTGRGRSESIERQLAGTLEANR